MHFVMEKISQNKRRTKKKRSTPPHLIPSGVQVERPCHGIPDISQKSQETNNKHVVLLVLLVTTSTMSTTATDSNNKRSNNTITVSWEIAKYLIPAVSKAEPDPEAVLLLCKLANPEWADVTLDDFSMEQLSGGFSGNVPSKCTAKGKTGSMAFKIIPPEEDGEDDGNDNEDTMCSTAFRLWSKAGIVPTVHLLGNPDAPGIEIYEFIEGRSAGWEATKHGPEFMHNQDDAASFGKLVGVLHGQPSDWYEPFKDELKPQWESWQSTMKSSKEALEMRNKYGDYASLVVLFSNHIADAGKNGAAIGKSLKDLSPILHEQLEPNSLLGRMVIGHGDMHGANLLHRTREGHGDLVAIDLDFVGRIPAAIDLGTALGSTMSGPYGYFFNKGEPIGEYPSLERRRLVAKSYLEGLGEDLTKKGIPRSDVDDILFDMEVGAALRILWVAPIVVCLGLNTGPSYCAWSLLHFCKACTNIFETCKTDMKLKKRVVEEGVTKIYTEKILELGMKPIQMTPEQFEAHWDVFGTIGPAFSGPYVPDDPPLSAEDMVMNQSGSSVNKISSFQAAVFRLYDSTSADIKTVFDRFDADGSGFIDMHELMACAVVCGVGFTSLEDAEKAFAHLDSDGDGKISLDEFKTFLTEAA